MKDIYYRMCREGVFMDDESTMIKKARQGDREAMECIFRFHAEHAVRLAYLITRDRSCAEDIAQDSFIRAFKSIGTFKDGRPFAPWFARIVVNQARKVKVHIKPYIMINDIEEIPFSKESPEESVVKKEDQKKLVDAIYALGEKYYLPVFLKYFNNFSEAEIADILKIPVSTVKSRLYSARQNLKKITELKEAL